MMAEIATEELRFVQTEDGYVRSFTVTVTEGTVVTTCPCELEVSVIVDAAGRIQAHYAGSGVSARLMMHLAEAGKTIAEARALARALDRAADKAAVRQILGGA